ncbi:MAG: serine protease [Desulfamplus sp.]|nr:serine protease [Desulfamplus sp.]
MKKVTPFFIAIFLIVGFCLPSQSFAKQIRIVGGNPVDDPSKYPWMTAIVDSAEIQEDINSGQFCGGTLIAPQWVVTAAHCVCDSPTNIIDISNIDVVLGAVDLKAAPDTYERIEVSRIIVHPDYDPSLTDNDVALIKLKRASAQTPIDLIATPDSYPSLNISSSSDITTMATAIGWGDTEAQKQRSLYPNHLQEIVLPLLSNQECGNFFGEGEITDNMLCAGFAEGGKDACFGDSGGPLVIPYQNGGYNLIGIVSWGNGCAQPNSYGVYTRVSKMRDWIFEQIRLANAPIVLTDSKLITIYSGSELTVYGSSGINSLYIQKSSNIKLINFQEISFIAIQGDSSLFLVSRLGATVTLKDKANETTIIMPATKNIKLIMFENLTTTLKIQSNKVMLGNQEVSKSEQIVNPI